MEGYSLRQNPFALLRVSPRAKLAEIEDAFEDAVIERPAEEQSLLKTKQLLLTPNARLIAELSWLSEVAPRRADQLVAMLERADSTGLLKATPDLPPISSANLAAEAAARLGDLSFIPLLIRAHGLIGPTETLDWLNSTRATAGFARVEPAQVTEALRTLRSAHARSAVAAIVAGKDPPGALADLLTASADPHAPLLKEIFREYDHWSSPHLAEIERDIDAALVRLMAGETGAVGRLNALLTSWDELSQPAQLYSQLSGLDEERSLRIYRRVRSHCIDLANDHQRFEEAHVVAAVMRDLFRELPTAAAELATDVDTLARLSGDQKLEAALSPLYAAMTTARTNVTRTLAELKAAGFSERAGPNVAGIHRAFTATAAALAGSENADAPIRVVRSFALDLNNDHDDPPAALALLKGLRAMATPADEALTSQIATDIVITENNSDHRLLKQAIASDRFGEAVRIVEQMVARTPSGEEASQLRSLQAQLTQRRNRGWLKWAGWAAAGLFVLYLIMQGNNGSSYTPPATYAPETPAATATSDAASAAAAAETAAADAVAAQAAAPTETASAADEAQPPVGDGLALEASQVRYCTFQKARLTALQALVTESNATAVDDFNSRVSDYNSRCSSFRYHAADLEAAKAIAERDAGRFAAEARTIAQGWDR